MDQKYLAAMVHMRTQVEALPRADRERVQACAQQLRDVLQAHGAHGLMALGLVGAETRALTL